MNAVQPIVDVDVQNFTTEVVERSQRTPVLVQFHATWCGPCQTLGPILEGLATEHAGGFVLARIDIDRSPELAEAFGVQSVPAVILVQDGRPVDGFMGALPEPEVRRFLETHAVGAAAPDPLTALDELEAAGRLDEAIEALDELLAAQPDAASPDEGALRVRLARLLLEAERVDEARVAFERVPDAARASEEARAVALRLEAAGSTTDLAELEAAVAAAPDDLARRLELGRALVVAGRREEGLETLLDVAKVDLAFDDGAPRKALLEMFELLGADDPLTLEFQQRLSVLLCV